ncbi:hypothetical protein Acr_00g0040860 [Actinidia rufa]|uniref:Transmembrane protein n=1 Tax=Actinidia rufa TaxID=165716 RepID=A0A7J0DI13_9ERIC|nr:hypothetical protein Acr_00g0040860 [Actinidia rufa]
MAAKALLIFSLLSLILFNGVCSATKVAAAEDLSFLQEDDVVSSNPDPYHHGVVVSSSKTTTETMAAVSKTTTSTRPGSSKPVPGRRSRS